MSWHPDNYLYRKLISITGQAGAGTDYQVPLTVAKDVVGSLEEQTTANSNYYLTSGAGNTRVGQKVTISNRTIEKLSFHLEVLQLNGGGLSGDVTFCIRGTDDDNVVSGLTKDFSVNDVIAGGYDWYEVTFDSPGVVNEEVYLSCEFSGGDALNAVVVVYQNSDVKASEHASYYDGSWNDEATYDLAYKYTYVGEEADGIVELDDLCTDFPNDIRFTDDDGVTELDHFCEDLTADPAKFWIEVADDLDDNQDIYIYFGKAGAGSASNAENTFNFFDDFTGDLSKWTVKSGTWAISSNRLYYSAGTSLCIIYSDITVPTNYRAEAQITNVAGWTELNAGAYVMVGDYEVNAKMILGTVKRKSVGDSIQIWKGYSGGYDWIHYDGDGTCDKTADNDILRFTKNGNDGKVYLHSEGGVLKDSFEYTNADIGNNQGKFAMAGYAGRDSYVNWVYLAKYIDPEPVVGTPGSLESLTVVTPSTLAQTLTKHIPILREKITPTTLTLSDTEYAPILKEVLTPSTLALSLTEYVPVLKEVITPTTLSIALTKYIPVLKELLTPTTAALTITGYSSILKELLTPSTLVLSLTPYIPPIGSGVVPTTLALSTAKYIPILKELITPSTLALATTRYSPVIDTGIIIPITIALALTKYAPTIMEDITDTDTGEGSEAVSLLVDALLREIAGISEGISIDETFEAVSETGTGTDTVTVDKAQVYRMVSQIRPLYNILSIIRERYKLNSTIRERYKVKSHVREG